MNIQPTSISYQDTHSFTRLILDYIDQSESLKDLITAFPSEAALADQLLRKEFSPEKRSVLHDVIQSQYTGLDTALAVQRNIDLLLQPSTFTICTAHQPNIFTGYLYFIYKIVHAIKLASECSIRFPQHYFVPVYYMGSEDNDLDEIGHLNYHGKAYNWSTNQHGACGRMDTGDLKPVLDELINTLNPDIPDEQYLSDVLSHAYRSGNSLAEATRILVNALFGRFGLLVLDADHPALKKLFIPVMKDELLHASSERIVNETIRQFPTGYTIQAHPRPLNLFYLRDNFRERIESNNDQWAILQSDLVFKQAEILDELHMHPERFSPNVILRPLYQETILPNIAFIGGGGEIAYWLELKHLFEHHGIIFPLLLLRNSVAWIDRKSSAAISKLELPVKDFFLPKELLLHKLLDHHESLLQLEQHLNALDEEYRKMQHEASAISPLLGKSVLAHQAKARRIHERLRQKYMNHLKKQSTVILQHVDRIQACLFPSGKLQERHDNFLSLFKQYGIKFIDLLLENQQALGTDFLILQEWNDDEG